MVKVSATRTFSTIGWGIFLVSGAAIAFSPKAPSSSSASTISLEANSRSLPQKLETKKFKVCGVELTLEVADEPKETEIGLMYRNSVPSGTGMVFVFQENRPLSFWMKNVPMDIDIGYFSSKGNLLNFYTMSGTTPLQRDAALPLYKSTGPAQYAVEVESGFYAGLGTKAKNCKLSPLP